MAKFLQFVLEKGGERDWWRIFLAIRPKFMYGREPT